jgi:alkylation response protein AidB-like acyl-CoA dehydrogenase
MNSELKLIESFLQTEIVPLANKIDRDPETLKLAFNKMGKRSWLALKVDPALGGTGLTEIEYCCLQISIARASGALTFLQTQHQSAVSKLAQSNNSSLQQFFPDVATGKVKVGVGFSHLRRRGTPMLQAYPTATGYRLTGKVPWITGYKFFDYFIVGATMPDGRELYGLLPFQTQSSKLAGKIDFSKPMELLAVAATNTVSAEIEEWLLDRDRVVTINPPGSIHISSRRNILNHGCFALGCAHAALDLLEKIAQKKQLDFLHRSRQSLQHEVTKSESKAIASISDPDISYQQKLQLRLQSIDLAQRCSFAAVIASSGAANYLHSDAARIYREALLFSVSGQTTDVMEGSLNLLTH